MGTVQGWNPFFGDLSGPLPRVVWPMLLTVPCLMRRLDPDAAAWSFVAIALLQLLFGPAMLTIDIFAAPMLFTAIVYGSRTHARDFIMAAALMTCIASAFYGYSTTAVSMMPIAQINGEQPPVPSFTLMWDSQRGELLSGISGGILTIGICIIVAITTGLWRRATRESAALLREHNRILARTQQDAQREAAIRERARIARDMHDVVAHTLSTIIVQADAGRYAGTQDLAMARRTMETIRRETTHAQHDMNQLLGVLNVPQDAANASHGAHMTPDVGYDAIPRLISQACLGPGAMAVTHAVLGRPSPESLSANGSICAFRVVQEALTNARKYAAGSLSADTQTHAGHTAHTTVHVSVTESWDRAPRNGNGGGLHLSVTDDGIGAASGTDGHQPGFGLLGMRERVDALGGSLQAGPRSALEEAGTPGFRVDAFIPFESRGSSDLSEDLWDASLPGDASLPVSSAGASGATGTVNGDAATVVQSPAGMRPRTDARIAKRRKDSVIERMARWSMRHPLAVDTVVMMTVALAKSSVIGSTGIQPWGLPVELPFTVLATVLMLLPCVPLCMRRTKPDLSCMLIFAACMVELTFIGWGARGGFAACRAVAVLGRPVRHGHAQRVGTGATCTSIYADASKADAKGRQLIKETRGKLTVAPAGRISYGILPGTHIGDVGTTETVYKWMDDVSKGADPAPLLDTVAQWVRDDKETMWANAADIRKEAGMTDRNGYAEGEWNGEHVHFKRTWSGHEFTDGEVEDLLAGKDIVFKAHSSKTGRDFTAAGHLEHQTFTAQDGREVKYVGFKVDWSKVPEDVPDTFYGHTFTEEEKKWLRDGGTFHVWDLKSKKGSTFEADLRWGEREDGRKGFILDFGH
ncbi:MAG: histidine kinase [Bifidobacteriaceae bacterium]|nr:histidine kinase [Bifidobacteriaceae bacterium]